MAKGQTLGGDFIISLAVFLFILAIILPLFSQVTERIRNDNQEKELNTRSIFLSDALVKTSGYPVDWNTSTVVTIGFSDNEKLNLSKLRNFLEISYSQVKEAMSISDINFNMSVKDINGYDVFTGVSKSPVAYFFADKNQVQSQLNQPVIWDLYYGGSGTPNAGNSRSQYFASEINAFNAMVGNQSLYKTIIIEETSLTQSEVNIQGLKDFVRGGGILIFIGDADLISTGFLMQASTDSGADGIVANESLFIDAQHGENVTFNNSRYYFYGIGIDIYIASENNPSWAFAGKWNYGAGKIYFITDIAGNTDEPLINAVKVIGRKIEHGSSINQAESLTAIQRNTLLERDGSEFVKITIVLWK